MQPASGAYIGPVRACSSDFGDDLHLDSIRVSLQGAEMLTRHEEDLISFLEQNPDRLAPFLDRAGGVRRRWRLATIDPEGMDFASEDQNIRIGFTQRITTPEGLLRYLEHVSRNPG